MALAMVSPWRSVWFGDNVGYLVGNGAAYNRFRLIQPHVCPRAPTLRTRFGHAQPTRSVLPGRKGTDGRAR
eukprot:6880597-Pyramimonas_sp.AAC.1